MSKKTAELNEKFGIDDVLEFIEKNNLIAIAVNNSLAKCEIYLHGAHVSSFLSEGGKDILWMSKNSDFEENRPIRGGIPICWPWFGAHPMDRDKPSHGFARLANWQIVKSEILDDGSTSVTLEFISNIQTLRIWPYKFKLQNIITIGKQLEVELITENLDSVPIEISAALHSYFNISQIKNISISGFENGHYIDSIDENKEKNQDGLIKFDSEVDRIYINTECTCTIFDSGFDRKIIVEKNGSRSTVVWNPWIDKAKRMVDFGDHEYETMVCVETTNAYNDTITINPGRSHSLKTILYTSAYTELQSKS